MRKFLVGSDQREGVRRSVVTGPPARVLGVALLTHLETNVLLRIHGSGQDPHNENNGTAGDGIQIDLRRLK